MFNFDQMMPLLWAQFAGGFSNLPEELKVALQNLEINIVKDESQLRMVAREIVPGNPNTQKAADALFSNMIYPISKITGAFQCKINIYK